MVFEYPTQPGVTAKDGSVRTHNLLPMEMDESGVLDTPPISPTRQAQIASSPRPRHTPELASSPPPTPAVSKEKPKKKTTNKGGKKRKSDEMEEEEQEVDEDFEMKDKDKENVEPVSPPVDVRRSQRRRASKD